MLSSLQCKGGQSNNTESLTAQSAHSNGFPLAPQGSQGLGVSKEALDGEGNWACVKDVLGYNIDTEAATVTLPERKLQ